jgi:hypothetical protein
VNHKRFCVLVLLTWGAYYLFVVWLVGKTFQVKPQSQAWKAVAK